MSAENFRYAVLETALGWWSGDVIFLNSIEGNGGEFNKEIVRDIGKTYLVIRGFTIKEGVKSKKSKKSEDSNKSVIKISKLLNDQLANWPAATEDRAKFCAKLATDCQEKEFTKNQLASAMTKLMWFARPTDWTMFDRYAADGLAMKSLPADNRKQNRRSHRSRRRRVKPSAAVNRMRHFYACLDSLKYTDLLEMMRPVIKKKDLNPLWAERILDKYLMLVGPKSPVRKKHLDFYLEGLPSGTQLTLEELATELDAKCQNHDLIKHLDK